MAVVGVACLLAETPIVWQGALGDLHPSQPKKAKGFMGGRRGEEIYVKNSQRLLPPELREKIIDAVRTGAKRGPGHSSIWKMLRESGVDASRSTIRYYYYKLFPEKLERKGPCLDRSVRIKLYNEVKRLRERGYSYN